MNWYNYFTTCSIEVDQLSNKEHGEVEFNVYATLLSHAMYQNVGLKAWVQIFLNGLR